MSKNASMSRRIRRQYLNILSGSGADYYYPYGWYGIPARKANAYAALFFYKQFGRYEGVDFRRLQNIVTRNGDAECVYRRATEVPGADVRKCQSRTMQVGTADEMRRFALNVPGAHRGSLEALAVVKEVLST